MCEYFGVLRARGWQFCLLIALFANCAHSADNKGDLAKDIASKIFSMQEEAYERCPNCRGSVPAEPVSFPVEQIPQEFLAVSKTLPVVTSQDQRKALVELLQREKEGWTFLHPFSEVGINGSFIEFTSASMRLTCSQQSMVAEYVVEKGSPGFSDLPLTYLIPRVNSVKLPRFVVTPDDMPDYAAYVKSDEMERIGQFFSLSGASSTSAEVKRVIIHKVMPCVTQFPELTGVFPKSEVGQSQWGTRPSKF